MPATVAELEALPGHRALHRPSGRGHGLRRAGRPARRERPACRLEGAWRVRRHRPGSRPPPTSSSRAVSPAAGSMRSWTWPRGRARPRAAVRCLSARRRCALRAARSRSRRAEGSRRPVPADDALAARSPGRGRDRGAGGDLGAAPGTPRRHDADAIGASARAASNARASSTCVLAKAGCARMTARRRRARSGRHWPLPDFGYASRAMPVTAQRSTPDAAPPLPADDPAIFEMDLRGLRRHWASAGGAPGDLGRDDDRRRPPGPGARLSRSCA